MSSPIISVENLSKAYRIGVADEKHDTLAATVASWVKAPLRNLKRLSSLNTKASLPAPGSPLPAPGSSPPASDIHWALRDVSFEVNEGEVVGIIGRNGAGKSTLLKILSRITDPTSGRAVIRGRVSSLLEVGTGFHPELSGRDNVYMNGTILGMRKKEIDHKFGEIVEFSGVEKFIDTPIKRYSSGMKVRLAFSVAAHLEPEILIIDEVLAVGDQEFQNKCLGKMNEVSRSGRTVLFVSHNLAAIRSLCKRGVLLSSGQVACKGDIDVVLRAYQRDRSPAETKRVFDEDAERSIDRRRVLREIHLLDLNGADVPSLVCGRGFRLRLLVDRLEKHESLAIGVHFHDELDQRITSLHTGYQFPGRLTVSERGIIQCDVDDCQLVPGLYRLLVGIVVNGDQVERFERAITVEVLAADFYNTGRAPHAKDGVFLSRVRWSASSIP